MVLVLVAALSGCGGAVSDTGASPAVAAGAAGSAGAPARTGGSGGAGSAGAPSGASGAPGKEIAALAASLRVAHVDPGSPALDLCIGTLGADGAVAYDEAPLLAALGRPQGVVYTEVSTYVPIVTGRVVRFVVAGAGCAQAAKGALGAAATERLTLDAGAPFGHLAPRLTIAPSRRVGEGGAIVSAVGFVDEPENEQYGIHIRTLSFAHADAFEPAAAVDLADVDPFGATVTWFDALAYATPPTHSPVGKVSPRGFLWRPEIQLTDLAIRAGGATFATKGKLDVPSGDGNAYGVASVFLTGDLATGDVRAIACGDNAIGVGGLGACVVMAP